MRHAFNFLFAFALLALLAACVVAAPPQTSEPPLAAGPAPKPCCNTAGFCPASCAPQFVLPRTPVRNVVHAVTGAGQGYCCSQHCRCVHKTKLRCCR